jgi:hypothetical protein
MTDRTLNRLVPLLAALTLLAAVLLTGSCLATDAPDTNSGEGMSEFTPTTVQPTHLPACFYPYDVSFDPGCPLDPCDPFVTCPQRNVTMVDEDGDCIDDFGYDGPKDLCPLTCSTGNADSDGDLRGDACDPCPLSSLDDADGDGICENTDNCPAHTNPTQADADADGVGDACDQLDGDPGAASEQRPAGWPDVNCNGIARPAEGTCTGLAANLLSLVVVCSSLLADDVPCDSYVDTTGGSNTAAVCNTGIAHDLDLDGWGTACDNCPSTYNPSQADGDSDGQGDACES